MGFKMATTRTHVLLPAEVLRDIDALVGKRGRSSFLAEVARQEIERRRILKFLERKEPAWKLENHPELKRGSAAWVSKMRRQEEKARAANRG
jgi:metal-responsive CopG/Arc/MetJ family transcriptional regulator